MATREASYMQCTCMPECTGPKEVVPLAAISPVDPVIARSNMKQYRVPGMISYDFIESLWITEVLPKMLHGITSIPSLEVRIFISGRVTFNWMRLRGERGMHRRLSWLPETIWCKSYWAVSAGGSHSSRLHSVSHFRVRMHIENTSDQLQLLWQEFCIEQYAETLELECFLSSRWQSGR